VQEKQIGFNRLSVLRTLVCSVILAISGIACTDSEIEKLLVINGAYELQRRDFADSNAHHIYYKVDLKYPEAAIAASHFQSLKRLGWLECSGGNKEWDSYPEITEKGEFGVHQKLIYWAKDDRLLTISMRYYSDLSEDKRYAKPPNNSIQYVFIIVDSNRDLQTKHLKISCK